MHYSYLGNDIFIKVPVDVYLDLHKRLEGISIEGNRKLKGIVLEKGKDHLDIIVQSVLTPIYEAVCKASSCFNLLGWNITEEEILQEDALFSNLISMLESYEKEYSKLLLEIAGKEVYREFCKQTREKMLVVTKADFSSIVKSTITSELANAAIGAGYSVVNVIANVATRIKVHNKTLELSEKTRSIFLKQNIIKETLDNIEEYFLDKCSDPGLGVVLPSYELCCNNYDDERYFYIDENVEDEKKQYISALESAPYYPIVYEKIISKFGDRNNELSSIAKKYTVDLNRVKVKLLNTALQNFSKRDDIISQIRELEDYYGYHDKEIEKKAAEIYLLNWSSIELKDFSFREKNIKEILYLQDYFKEYNVDVTGYIDKIKNGILQELDLNNVSDLSTKDELTKAEDKLNELTYIYNISFEDELNCINKKIRQLAMKQEEDDEKRKTIYDVSDITYKQGIIKDKKVVLNSIEEASNTQNKIDEICDLFSIMNFDLYDETLRIQCARIRELAREFPYAKKIVDFVNKKYCLQQEEDAPLVTHRNLEDNEQECCKCGMVLKKCYIFCPRCGCKIENRIDEYDYLRKFINVEIDQPIKEIKESIDSLNQNNSNKRQSDKIGEKEILLQNSKKESERNYVQDIKFCPSCGKKMIASAKFCGQCGYSFYEKHCPNCNAVIKLGKKFCCRCGAKL